MRDCAEWQRRPGVRVHAGAWLRCYTFECSPCVRRRACLFANSEGEKGPNGEGDEECCRV